MKLSLSDVLKIVGFLLGLVVSACVLYAKLAVIDYRLARVEEHLSRLTNTEIVSVEPDTEVVRR